MSINICVPPELLTDDDYPIDSFDYYDRIVPLLIEMFYSETIYLPGVYKRRIQRQMDDLRARVGGKRQCSQNAKNS